MIMGIWNSNNQIKDRLAAVNRSHEHDMEPDAVWVTAK